MFRRNMLIPLPQLNRPARNVTYCLSIFSGVFTEKRDYSVCVKFAGEMVRVDCFGLCINVHLNEPRFSCCRRRFRLVENAFVIKKSMSGME